MCEDPDKCVNANPNLTSNWLCNECIKVLSKSEENKLDNYKN